MGPAMKTAVASCVDLSIYTKWRKPSLEPGTIIEAPYRWRREHFQAIRRARSVL